MNETEIKMIILKDIVVPDGVNPRKDLGDLSLLKESMAEVGVNIQAIAVREKGKGAYELLFGERRITVARQLDWKEIKAEVYAGEDQHNQALMALHENLGRKDLEWTEEARAFDAIVEIQKRDDGKEIQDVMNDESKKIGKSKRTLERMREAANAIRKYPFLEKEISREKALNKFYEIKKLPGGDQKRIMNGEDYKKILKAGIKKEVKKEVSQDVEQEFVQKPSKKEKGVDPSDKLIKNLNKEIVELKNKLMVEKENNLKVKPSIDEGDLVSDLKLKDEEIAVLRNKLDDAFKNPKYTVMPKEESPASSVDEEVFEKMDIYHKIKDVDKEERINNGVWLINEVIKAVRCGRACPAFGLKDDEEIDCNECENDEKGIKVICDWWYENILEKFEKIAH